MDAMDIEDMSISPRLESPTEFSRGETSRHRRDGRWSNSQKLVCSDTEDTVSMFADEAECNGDKSSANDISALAYNVDGSVVAVGDTSGHIALYQHQSTRRGAGTYKELANFKSHDRDFDYLRSLEIEESINKIAWCPSPTNSHFLLSTNDKTIKLWKIGSSSALPTTFVRPKLDRARTMSSSPQRRTSLHRPIPAHQLFKRTRESNVNCTSIGRARGREPTCKERRTYKNAHAYHVNSLSVSSDCETFLSADDLRVNLWKIDRHETCFTIVDMKPESMDALSEVLTSAIFHPHQSHIFAFSTSTGAVKLADMRMSALCDNCVKEFKDTTTASPNSFFAEILECISDISFTNSGNQLLLRDYMSLKLWDARMEHRPALVVDIQGYLVPKLRELYMNDLIFDKFKCSVSYDDSLFLTGTYGGVACAFERTTGKAVSAFDCVGAQQIIPSDATKTRPIDDPMWKSKAIHCQFNPKDTSLAVGTSVDMALFGRGDTMR